MDRKYFQKYSLQPEFEGFDVGCVGAGVPKKSLM